MCTVSFLPQASGGFVFTSNRDEAPDRSAIDLCETTLHGQSLLYPRDSGAGGTWIAISAHNRLVCVLNGAFTLHQRQPPYRRSRGLMALDYFAYSDLAHFISEYPFTGIEPFTFIVWEDGRLGELRWDGHTVHHRSLAIQQAHIWSSATLYDAAAQDLRKGWFADWQHRYPTPGPADILHFHTHAGADDTWNGVLMNRQNIVRTVSITQIVHTATSWQFTFRELIHERQSTRTLPLLRPSSPVRL